MTTMLRLKNVKIASEYAEADFFPEDGEEFGHVVVDLSTEEISSCDNVPGFGPSYVGHARQRLVRMAKEKDHRNECIVMWY